MPVVCPEAWNCGDVGFASREREAEVKVTVNGMD